MHWGGILVLHQINVPDFVDTSGALTQMGGVDVELAGEEEGVEGAVRGRTVFGT